MKTQLFTLMALAVWFRPLFGVESLCQTLRPSDSFLFSVTNRVDVESVSYQAAKVKETRLNRVDLLIVFDSSACDWLAEENRGTPEEYAAVCVEKMNKALKDSAIDAFAFCLVGTVTVDEDVSRLGMNQILSEKLVDEDGNFVGKDAWRNVYTAREKLGADIVSLLVGKGSSGVVGLSYTLESKYRNYVSKIYKFGDLAYSVCSIRAADARLLQLHEIAHTMGCGHADATCSSLASKIQLGPQLFTYSSGYYFWVGEQGYHTIMAYNYGGLRPDGTYNESDRFVEVPVFSSPLLSYAGISVGSAVNDNRRTLLETYSQVAQYRVSTVEDEITPEVESPLTFAKAVTWNGVCRNSAGEIAGSVQIKIGATNARTLTSKVSGTLMRLDGTKSSITFKNRMSCAEAAPSVVGSVKKHGAMTLVFSENGFTGTLEDGGTVEKTPDIVVGGALASEAPVFDFGAVPHEIGKWTVVTNLVPQAGEPFAVSGSRWTFAKTSTVKFRKGVLDDEALAKSQSKGKTNSTGLKLTYTTKTGVFKGQFYVYGTDSANHVKKMKVVVSGIVVNGVGWGLAQVKSLSAAWSVSVK